MATDIRARASLAAPRSRRSASAGCGSSRQKATTDGRTPTTRRRWPARRAPLAALHGEANELLPGGNDAYEQRIAALAATRSSPTSGPPGAGPAASSSRSCRSSRPRYGKRVAFLGVDTEDSEAARRATSSTRTRSPTPATPTPTRRSPTRSAPTRPPRHRLLRPPGQARLPQARPLHPRRRTRSRHQALRAGTAKRIIEAWKRSSSSRLIGIGLLVAELLLPTGGVLALLGIARAGRRRRSSRSAPNDRASADWIGGRR